jgi:hypothetical protein
VISASPTVSNGADAPAHTPSLRPQRSRTAIAAVLIVATTLAAYANGFTGRFAGLDARESIRDNPHIQHLWPLSEAMSLQLLSSTKAADEGSKGGTVVRRPILSLSFALNYAATGLSPDGFHAVNVAIHLCAGLLLFGIVRRTLGRPPYAEHFGHSADWVALATALLWTVHPLQTESVTYIVQRAESLMGLFFLVTVYAAVRSFDSPRPAPWQALAAVSSALGMATKEVAAVAPVIVLLYDTTFVSRSVRGALASHRRLYVALFATWGVLVGLMLMTLDDVGSDFSEGRNLSYALAQPTVILHYLRAALWPHPLHLYVNTTLYDALGARQIAAAGVVVAALACATLWGVVRRTWLGFVGAWFFLILAPSSSIVAVSDVVQEHRMYLSLAAVVLLVVIAAYELLRRAAGRAAAPLSALLAVGCVLVLATLTHARNRDYHSEFAMIHPADLYEAYEILGNHYTLGTAIRPSGARKRKTRSRRRRRDRPTTRTASTCSDCSPTRRAAARRPRSTSSARSRAIRPSGTQPRSSEPRCSHSTTRSTRATHSRAPSSVSPRRPSSISGSDALCSRSATWPGHARASSASSRSIRTSRRAATTSASCSSASATGREPRRSTVPRSRSIPTW